MERPAFKELLKDIENDEIDIVVVYKVDRLTRSLMDFSKLLIFLITIMLRLSQLLSILTQRLQWDD